MCRNRISMTTASAAGLLAILLLSACRHNQEASAAFAIQPQSDVAAPGSTFTVTASHLPQDCAITWLVDGGTVESKGAAISATASPHEKRHTVLARFRSVFSQWTDTLTNASTEERAAIQSIRQSCLSYDTVYTEYIDLRGIASAFSDNLSLSPPTRLLSQELLTQLEHLVICNSATNRFQGKLLGVGICWPHTQEQYEFYTMDSAAVPSLRMHRETSFSQLVRHLLTSPASSTAASSVAATSGASAEPIPGTFPETGTFPL